MFAAGMMFSVLLIMAWIFIKRTAYLSPVKRELKKEKQWLRRGEYNAAMVKGRQNLELLFKVVAANNGIRLDNTAAAQANARSVQERNHGCRGRAGRNRVMTHQQFGWWMEENGYLDRVAKWEMNQVRLIGNKAVHENDNTAYNANQAYQLLTKQVYAFSHDFQVAKTFTVPVTDTRPVRNARTGATTGSSGAGSASYGQTGGARPRTGTGAGQTAASRAQSSVRSQTSPRSQTSARTSNGTGNGPRSGAELQGLSSRSGANGSRRTAGSNSSTGSRNRNSQSTNRSYSGSSRSGRTRRRKHRPSPVAMVLKFLIPILVIVVLVVAIRTLVPGKKKADPTQPETMSTEMTSAETEAPTPEETQPPADVYVVTGNKVNVRTEPSTNGRILVQLEGGTEVTYVKRYNNDWTVINYDGQEAYVSSQYIAKQEAETTAETQAEAETAAEGETAANQ